MVTTLTASPCTSAALNPPKPGSRAIVRIVVTVCLLSSPCRSTRRGGSGSGGCENTYSARCFEPSLESLGISLGQKERTAVGLTTVLCSQFFTTLRWIRGGRRGSNPQQPVPQTGTLTIELRPPCRACARTNSIAPRRRWRNSRGPHCAALPPTSPALYAAFCCCGTYSGGVSGSDARWAGSWPRNRLDAPPSACYTRGWGAGGGRASPWEKSH